MSVIFSAADVSTRLHIAKVSNKPVEVMSCTLADFFRSEKNLPFERDLSGIITIPEYQRAYVWRERQIEKLLRDMIEYNQNAHIDKPLYYLGSLIIHRDGNQLKIIDGQQRITTMLILGSFMQNHSLPDVVYHSPESIRNITYNQAYIDAVFNHQVSDFPEISRDDLVDFSNINVTIIITDNEDLAYTFFETQNIGGLRLSGTDIVKAYHLRVINSKKLVAYYATIWEQVSPAIIENCIKHLIKVRYWKGRKWSQFPTFRNINKIKEVIIQEFTEQTNHDSQDVSFYTTIVKNDQGIASQAFESNFRQIRQPLHDGRGFLDYINEYVTLYQILFIQSEDCRVSDAFYEIRDHLIYGKSENLFLKELFEISLLAYVNRFGFRQVVEFAFWTFRAIYSLRLSSARSVQESSVFKFIKENYLIDTILESYTTDELFSMLKKFKCNFHSGNVFSNHSKDKHVSTVRGYFLIHGNDSFTSAELMSKESSFDLELIKGIYQRLKELTIYE